MTVGKQRSSYIGNSALPLMNTQSVNVNTAATDSWSGSSLVGYSSGISNVSPKPSVMTVSQQESFSIGDSDLPLTRTQSVNVNTAATDSLSGSSFVSYSSGNKQCFT